jgi:glycine/D-amino acid oxidase-like deaminating enzyme
VGVLIIGGGIIGLSIAYHLSKRRYFDVTIIEIEKELAVHASGHNASGLVPPRESIVKEFWELHQESLKLFNRLTELKGFQFDYKVNGYLIIKGNGSARKELLRTVRVLRARGVNVNLLEGSELQEVEPNLSIKGIDSSLYYPEGAQGNSKKLATCFARSCVKKAIEIKTDTNVTGFGVKEGKIELVKTNRGDFCPDTVVLAAGPWSGGIAGLLGLDLPVKPAKGHLISVQTKRKNLVRRFVVGPDDYYVTQIPSGDLIVGGGVDFVGFDTKADNRRMREAWEEGLFLFPFLRSMKQKSTITCFRPHAPGGVPVIGKSGRYSNLVFATGHHTHGFTLAPVTGSLTSQLILDGETKKDISSFSPARFKC